MLNINKYAFAKAYLQVFPTLYLGFLSNKNVKKHVLGHNSGIRTRMYPVTLTPKSCISITLIYSSLCHHVTTNSPERKYKRH